MRKKLTLITLLLIVSTAIFALQAQADPVYFTVDGTPYVPQYTQTANGFEVPDQTISGSGWQVRISAVVDNDPFITFTFQVKNTGSSSNTYAFLIAGVPISLPAGPTVLNSSIGGKLTDATGNGVSIAPGSGNTLILDNTLGLSSGTLKWSVGPAASFGASDLGSVYDYGLYTFTSPGPDGPFTDIDFGESVRFTLSGDGDSASLTGSCSIDPVPLPGALWLFGTGLAGLVAYARRRQDGI